MATTARVRLEIIISGAGLAGLACAASLARTGHSVTVLESKNDLSEIGAGIQLPPNSSRVLMRLGLQDEISKASVQRSWLQIRRYATGEELRQVRIGEEHTGMPTWLIHRAELQRILYDCAIAAGVFVKFDHRITAIDCSGPIVRCANEACFNADLVLLAEGIGSPNRKYIVGENASAPKVRRNAYRLMIPREDMEKDAQLFDLLNTSAQQLWTGPYRYVIAYPISQGRFYNVVLTHPGEPEPGVWNKQADLEVVKEEFSDFEPTVLKLINLAKSAVDWTLARLPPLPQWSDKTGKVLLLGDAAHAMTPDLAQGAAMGFEDATVIAECMLSLRAKEDVPRGTAAFEGLRRARVEKIQDQAWENSHVFSMPDGPGQEARDLMLKSGKPESQGDLATRKDFLMWLYETDAAKEAKEYIEQLFSNQSKL